MFYTVRRKWKVKSGLQCSLDGILFTQRSSLTSLRGLLWLCNSLALFPPPLLTELTNWGKVTLLTSVFPDRGYGHAPFQPSLSTGRWSKLIAKIIPVLMLKFSPHEGGWKSFSKRGRFSFHREKQMMTLRETRRRTLEEKKKEECAQRDGRTPTASCNVAVAFPACHGALHHRWVFLRVPSLPIHLPPNHHPHPHPLSLLCLPGPPPQAWSIGFQRRAER